MNALYDRIEKALKNPWARSGIAADTMLKIKKICDEYEPVAPLAAAEGKPAGWVDSKELERLAVRQIDFARLYAHTLRDRTPVYTQVQSRAAVPAGWKLAPEMATQHQVDAMNCIAEAMLTINKVDVSLVYATGVRVAPSPEDVEGAR
jgi:hypothetical protein